MKRGERFRGPSLTLLAVVHILLLVAGLAVAAVLRHGTPYATPFSTGDAIRSFFAASPAAVRVGNFFFFGSAIPFGIFTATVVSRLRFLGVRAAGTQIALFGGFMASTALALSGLFGWVLSLPDVLSSAATVRGLYFLCFLLGGMTFAVGFGLLIAGISITCYFTHLLPRWLSGFGVVIAAAGELSSLSLVWFPANFLIPVTRYLGLIWLLFAAVHLSHKSRREGATSPAIS